MFHNILVPLDGSAFAEQALPWALAIARRVRGTMDLVRGHVLYTDTCWGPFDVAADEKCRAEEQRYLDGTARWWSEPAALPITGTVVHGHPPDGILEQHGCRDAELLEHLRGVAAHCLACWALDVVLGQD